MIPVDPMIRGFRGGLRVLLGLGCLALVLGGGLGPGGSLHARTPLPGPDTLDPSRTPPDFSEVVGEVQPTVVTIYTRRTTQGEGFRFRRGPRARPGRRGRGAQQLIGLGSGVVIRSDGFILTNEHVVDGADDIGVIFPDGSMHRAERVGTDPRADLAVVAVDRTGLPTVEFADSDRLRSGQWALALGSPYGLHNTVTLGIVSTIHRQIGVLPVEDFVQIDAAINQGSSGGPLVDAQGRLIGINTLIESISGGNEGIGFAVSSRLAHRTARDLVQYGESRRPVLGVTLENVTPGVLKSQYGVEHGVLVRTVKEESPAARAGIQPEDVLLEYAGQTVTDVHQVSRLTWQQAPGDTVEVVLQRQGTRQSLAVSLSEQ